MNSLLTEKKFMNKFSSSYLLIRSIFFFVFIISRVIYTRKYFLNFLLQKTYFRRQVYFWLVNYLFYLLVTHLVINPIWDLIRMRLFSYLYRFNKYSSCKNQLLASPPYIQLLILVSLLSIVMFWSATKRVKSATAMMESWVSSLPEPEGKRWCVSLTCRWSSFHHYYPASFEESKY